jgi:hypothetical protein
MKQSQKTTVTLSMLWLGAMIVASQPGWIRNVLGFVTGSTATTTVVTHGGAAGGSSSGGGSAALTP